MILLGDKNNNLLIKSQYGIAVPTLKKNRLTFSLNNNEYYIKHLESDMYSCYMVAEPEPIGIGFLTLKLTDNIGLVHRQYLAKELSNLIGRRFILDKQTEEPYFKIGHGKVSYVSDILDLVASNLLSSEIKK